MKRSDLRELAKLGMPTRLRQIEDQLAAWHTEFPELFISKTPPQLLKPALNETVKRTWGGARTAALVRTAPKLKSKSKKYSSPLQVTKRRQRSLETLNMIEENGPMTSEALKAKGIDIRAVLPLVRRGYLKHTTAGFTRLGKEFTVKKAWKKRKAA